MLGNAGATCNIQRAAMTAASLLIPLACGTPLAGATGSGKTHTMLGTPAQHGMIPRAMAQLFAASAELEAAGWSFDMKVLQLIQLLTLV